MQMSVFRYVYVHRERHFGSIASWIDNHFCFGNMPKRKAFEAMGGSGSVEQNSDMPHLQMDTLAQMLHLKTMTQLKVPGQLWILNMCSIGCKHGLGEECLH